MEENVAIKTASSASVPNGTADAQANYRRRMALGFGLFAIFFVFYLGTAVIQTPTFRSLAGIPVFGIPLGLFLSLCVFPVSWIRIVIYF